MTDRRYNIVTRNVFMAIGVALGRFGHMSDTDAFFVMVCFVAIGWIWPERK